MYVAVYLLKNHPVTGTCIVVLLMNINHRLIGSEFEKKTKIQLAHLYKKFWRHLWMELKLTNKQKQCKMTKGSGEASQMVC